MGYPAKLLGEDEEVVLELHPHWKRLVGPVLLIPVVVGVASFLAFALPSGSYRPSARWTVVVVAAAVLVVFSLWPLLRWRATNYVFTNHRVVIRTGVLSRTGRDIPLARVNDVSFFHSLVDRVLGCGTLTVESAGERGQVVLDDVPRVEEVQSELYRLVEAENERREAAER